MENEGHLFHKRGKPECVVDTARGFRDVWWCWIINEPEFPTYGGGPDGKHVCPGCGFAIEDLEDEHTFIAHILKPR